MSNEPNYTPTEQRLRAELESEQTANSELVEALKNHVKSWESLEGNKMYSPKEIEKWLINEMSPSINNMRNVIAKHNKQQLDK